MPDLLVLSGGHPYEAGPFEDLLAEVARALGGWRVVHLVHPEAEEAVAAGAADEAAALLFYDMAGYTFGEGKVSARPPSDGFKAALKRRFASGKGAVAMHHALAGWAEWPEWADMLGGRFFYQAGEWHGAAVPDSGYRHDVRYAAQVVADHPVTAGLPASFPVTDELYLCPIDESVVHPLLRADHAFIRGNFYSAASAVAGEMFSNKGWEHPEGSNLVAWWKVVDAAPLVYLQFGDGPDTYANREVQRILANALRFTAGEQP
ncbi:MAG: ThuA domain-containing protein [Erythrobacter sp.]